jgi:hypothetical protein
MKKPYQIESQRAVKQLEAMAAVDAQDEGNTSSMNPLSYDLAPFGEQSPRPLLPVPSLLRACS